MKKQTFKQYIKRMNKSIFGASLLVLALGCNVACGASDGSAQDGQNKPAAAVAGVPGQPVDLTYAAEKAVNSVVSIKVTINSKTQTVEYYDPFEDFFFGNPFGFDPFGDGNSQRGRRQQRQMQTPKKQGSGSGVIISADGYIVTNNHVVEGADEIDVKLNDNRDFKARIIGLDKTTDLALLKVEAKDLQPIVIGNSDDLKLGEWVLAVGNPYNLTSTVTAGIVSAKARSVGAGSEQDPSKRGIESFIQTDAAINPGNSGGALVNARGELVGINAMIYSQTGSYAGYGFAIPTTIMNKVVEDLKKFGTVQRAVLGIQGGNVSDYIESQQADGKEVDLGTVKGVYVDKVESGSAADKAGIEKGDVITAINGKEITKMSELQENIATHKPGDKVTLTYLRNKKEHTATATLRNAQGTTDIVKSVSGDDLGIAVRELTDREKQQYALGQGLMVVAVNAGKMKQAGVTKGIILLQINDRVLTKQADFEDAVREANSSQDRVLWVRAVTQSGRRVSFTVELGDENGD